MLATLAAVAFLVDAVLALVGSAPAHLVPFLLYLGLALLALHLAWPIAVRRP